jgi:RNA polymerase sigma-70 factor, ECF subfamily
MNEVIVRSRPNADATHPAAGVELELEAKSGSGPRRRVRHSGTVEAGTSVEHGPLDFDAVYVANFQEVSRWARALGGLEADLDDLTQEVFLVVRRKLASYAGPSLPAWLYGITRKTVSDYRRRAFMRRLLGGFSRSLDAGSEPESDADGAMHSSDRWEARRILRRVLARMSRVRRSAFILFEIEGYSGEEIAELEQIPLATVYTRLHHARKDFLRFTAEITGDPPEEPPP